MPDKGEYILFLKDFCFCFSISSPFFMALFSVDFTCWACNQVPVCPPQGYPESRAPTGLQEEGQRGEPCHSAPGLVTSAQQPRCAFPVSAALRVPFQAWFSSLIPQTTDTFSIISLQIDLFSVASCNQKLCVCVCINIIYN